MSSGGKRAWRGTLALWAATVAVCAAVAGATWAVEASARRAVAEGRRLRVLSGELSRSVTSLHAETIEQVEARLNGGRPLPRVPGSVGPRLRVAVAGEALEPRFKGWEVRLTFFRMPMQPPPLPRMIRSPDEGGDEDEGASQAAGVAGRDEAWSPYFLHSYAATPPPAHPGPSAWTVVQVARLRGAALVFGGLGFVTALLTLPFARRWRRQVAQVMLACVLVAAAGWAAEPGRSWSLAMMTAPVPLALAFGALVGVCALAPPVHEASAARCGTCGYDLTGNASGVCPECGTPTPRGRVERWRGIAERIEHVGDPGATSHPSDGEDDDGAVAPAEPA